MSSVFQPLAEAEADSLGLAGLGLLVVEHPVATRSNDELITIGISLAPAALRILTGGDAPVNVR